VGDTITLRAVSRRGYSRSVNLKVYGVFTHAGLEKAPQAGALNLMDLVSFRELYGLLTDDTEKEVQAIRAAAGARDLSRSEVEAALFGSVQEDATAPEHGSYDNIDASVARRAAGSHEVNDAKTSLDVRQLQHGPILNAAVFLRNPALFEETRKDIEVEGRRVGLSLRAISWREASGAVGDFVSMMYWLLYAAGAIIVVVALMIVSNVLMISTLDRVREMGTLRAIGAHAEVLFGMVLSESLLVGLFFGGLGTLVGAGCVLLAAKFGVPAASDVLTFLFSGPTLRPIVQTSSLAAGLVTGLCMSLLASVYPAWLAMRISPREAMATED
jgi:hypothetical protein